MIRKSRSSVLTAAVLLCAAQSAFAQHKHEGDFIVGVTGEGQVGLEFDAEEAFELPPVSGPLTGWLGDEPGFMALEKDEPKENFFVLGAGANIVFELVSIDPALQVWTPGFGSVLDEPGETWKIGGADFDAHPEWHINSLDPTFDPADAPWALTFRLVDIGTTGYEPSADLTISFVGVPEPSTLMLLVCGGAMALLRREKRGGMDAAFRGGSSGRRSVWGGRTP